MAKTNIKTKQKIILKTIGHFLNSIINRELTSDVSKYDFGFRQYFGTIIANVITFVCWKLMSRFGGQWWILEVQARPEEEKGTHYKNDKFEGNMSRVECYTF